MVSVMVARLSFVVAVIADHIELYVGAPDPAGSVTV
jgi:hypothetical protein